MARPRKNKYKVTVLYNDGGTFEVQMSINEDIAERYENEEDLAKFIIIKSGFGKEDYGFNPSNRIIDSVESGEAKISLFQYAKRKTIKREGFPVE